MSAELSVHHNRLLCYAVNCEERRVTFHTGFFDCEPHDYTEVVFSGVAAYHFEGDTFGTILFDISQTPLEEIYASYREIFTRRKNYGWPLLQYEDEEDLICRLRAEGIRGYLISSSCGMDGFVMSRSMHVRPSSQPAPPAVPGAGITTDC